MSRIVLACWGSYGDLFPYLGLADELKARGHAPIIATCPHHVELVEKAGFACRPLRPDVNPDDAPLLARVMDPKQGAEVVLRELIVPAARDAYADLFEATPDADLIVSHPATFAAPMVAEKRQLPWVSTILSPVSFFSVHDFPVVPNAPALVHVRRLGPWMSRLQLALARRMTNAWMAPVHALRAELGLPPAGSPLFEGQFSPFGTIAMFSRQLGAPQPDWPAHAHLTGFSFFNRAIAMPDEVSRFLDAGDPPIVFTLGSAAVGAAGTFYQESAKAMTMLGRRAVLLVGRNPDNIPRDLPASVLAVESAPHDQLFPRAAAVVHQGGVGTTGQAMRSGRPTLVVPHAHDQPDNAFRVKNLGIARVLYPKQYVASRVATHLRALLEEPRYAERAAVIGRQMEAEDGAIAAVDVILSVLASD